MIDLIRCYLFNKHKDCWIIGEENGSAIAMCPKCCKKVIKIKDNLYITYKKKEK